ncbi:hypothetical protein RND81_07G172000 [Saponaria officinalis]|uniref:Transposase, Ptta/En/Spm, plant n=1 Tax=Saponaria officinalis TaxID=3572 RepID=A0AAW1JT92_SAPOF
MFRKRNKGKGSSSKRPFAGDDNTSEEPAGDKKPHLDPSDLWFNNTDVVKLVVQSMKAHYTEFCPSWKLTPPSIREAWWNYFQNTVTFDKEFEDEVKSAFFKKCKDRLKDIIYRVSEDEVPDWMDVDIHAKVIARRNDKEFKSKSATAKANRAKLSEDGKILGTHRMGSISTVEQAERMDAYMARRSQLQQEGKKVDEDELYYEIVGGRKKDKVYGIGSAADMYFDRGEETIVPGGPSTKGYSPGIMRRLTSQNERLEKELQDLRASQEAKFAEMEARFHTLSQSCNPGIPPYMKDHFDDGGSGAAGSFPVIWT